MQHLLVAKNAFYQALARSITSLIGFLITIVIARQFGVLGYGDFTKITSYVAIFYLVLDFGLNAIFIQYEKPKFKDLFYLRVLVSVTIFIVLNLIAFFLPYNQYLNTGFSQSVRAGIFIFSFSIFAQSVILSASAIFQKSFRYSSYMIGMVAGAVFNLIAVLIFSFLNFSISYILLSFVVSSFVSAVILFRLTKEKILPVSLDKHFAKEILFKSLPIGLMLIFNLVYFRIDMILLSIMAPTQDVGIYGLSYKFFDFLIALPLFLSNAVYPLLIQAKTDVNRFNSLIKKYFLVFLGFSFVILIPFWFVSPLFTLIKADFSASIIPFRILLLSLPFFFTTSFLQWIMITLGKQKYLMYVYLFSALLNVLLNIVFIPKFSYIASASITLISEGLVFVFLVGKLLFDKNIQRKTIETANV